MEQKMLKKFTATILMPDTLAPIHIQAEKAEFAEAAQWAIDFATKCDATVVGVKETVTREKKDK